MQMQLIKQPAEGATMRMRRIWLEPAPVRDDHGAEVVSRT
jgi:hypothetical protein